jgi:Glycoside-hydrolase family GH114
MSFSVIPRSGVYALALVVLLSLAGVASAAKGVTASGVVIATPGKHGVEIVAANHQARLLTTRHRAKAIRPGAVVRYTVRKKATLPVVFRKRLSHVKGTYVIGVAVRGGVRLADGTRLLSSSVKAGVAALRVANNGNGNGNGNGVHVRIKLHFDGGHTHVGTITATASNVPPKTKNGSGSSGTKTTAPVTSTPVIPVSTPVTAGSWWQPSSAKPLTLHWVLDGPVNLSDPVQLGLRGMNGAVLPAPDVYDIDGELNSAATVAALHAMGKKVICYVDAGVYETYRSDASKFPPGIWGNADAGWAGSYWLDIRRVADLAPIMQARFQMCKSKGFDAIEPDEITGWSNNSGFPLTYADQITYNRALAGWAHAIGMSIGLKGDIEQAHDLVGDFDWTLNEQCYEYSECTTVSNEGPGADGKDWPGVQLFSQAGKAVWIAEYKGLSASQCADAVANHFNASLYVSGLPLDGGRQPCTGTW